MRKLLLFILTTLLIPYTAVAEDATSIVDSISNGEAHLSFRYRLETVDLDQSLRDKAVANTVRTRLNYKTKKFSGFNLFLEVDDVSYLADDKFNNTRNGETTYQTVADPDGAGLNQFYFDYTADSVLVRLGRQRVNLDNQRFVGGVGWRQNEQTYDALTFIYTGISDLRIIAAYINNVSRIFGPEEGNPASDLDTKSSVLNINYKAGNAGDFTVYAYNFDIEDAPAVSNRTMGLRYTNKFGSDDLTFPVALEFAKQNDTGDNPNDYSANYLLFEGGVNTPYVNAKIGRETLGGDVSGGSAFITPLATLHKFQGWADVFLNTPSVGIVDTYVTFSRNFSGHKVGLTHHSFETEDSAPGFSTYDYGTETDISYATKATDNLSVVFKVARFTTDTGSIDFTKMWLMLTATF